MAGPRPASLGSTMSVDMSTIILPPATRHRRRPSREPGARRPSFGQNTPAGQNDFTTEVNILHHTRIIFLRQYDGRSPEPEPGQYGIDDYFGQDYMQALRAIVQARLNWLMQDNPWFAQSGQMLYVEREGLRISMRKVHPRPQPHSPMYFMPPGGIPFTPPARTPRFEPYHGYIRPPQHWYRQNVPVYHMPPGFAQGPPPTPLWGYPPGY